MISIAMVAVRCVTKGGLVTEIAVAIGACGPVAARQPGAERALIGVPLTGLTDRLRPEDLNLSPIDDIRAGAAYRREAAFEMVRRALAEVAA